MQNDEITDFGYEEVPLAEKQRRVGAVFTSVAQKYDLMNDVMSFGVHRLWKSFTLEMCGLRPGQRVLDLAGGTGDLALKQARRVGPSGQVVLADINAEMLRLGRDRSIDKGLLEGIDAVQCNAEILPFEDASFDCITIAFGLRNVTHKQSAINSMYRALKPGGRLLILEFSRPAKALRPAYDFYSFNILPRLGRLIARDEDSYRYLAESIRMHPDQQTLKGMMEAAGFEDCDYHNLTGGIVAIHRGYKY
jgi:demethylmenaquinone methyltransferase / 2-methoxy-6-polyprenyl-1,4-benzoquinol methylase